MQAMHCVHVSSCTRIWPPSSTYRLVYYIIWLWYMYKVADICTGTDKDAMPRCLSTCVKAYSLLNAMFRPNSFQSSAYRPGQSQCSVSWLIHFSFSFHGKPSNHTRNQMTLGCLETWLFASIHVAPLPMLWWNILHIQPLGIYMCILTNHQKVCYTYVSMPNQCS